MWLRQVIASMAPWLDVGVDYRTPAPCRARLAILAPAGSSAAQLSSHWEIGHLHASVEIGRRVPHIDYFTWLRQAGSPTSAALVDDTPASQRVMGSHAIGPRRAYKRGSRPVRGSQRSSWSVPARTIPAAIPHPSGTRRRATAMALPHAQECSMSRRHQPPPGKCAVLSPAFRR